MANRTKQGPDLRRSGGELVRRRTRAGRAGLAHWWSGEDRGSGTSMGVALVALVALGLILVALVGNLLICQSRARIGADASALAAAASLMGGGGIPCDQAGVAARANQGRVASCRVEGEDVVVEVTVNTGLVWIPQVTQAARAGPKDCL